MLHKFFKKIGLEDIVKCRFYTAAQDRVVPPGNVCADGSSYLVLRGLVGASPFKNVLATIKFPYNDSVSGKYQSDVIFTRTTPVGDANWQAAPIGTIAIFHTVASTVITDAKVLIKNISGSYQEFLTTDQNTIDTSATTARAGSAWHGLRIKSKVPTGVTCAGHQSGLYIETEVTGTGICSGSHYGLKIETYVVSTATITGDHYGIAVFTYSDIAGNQAIDCLRLEHNGASVAQGFFNLQAQAGKMRWWSTSSTTDATWMSITTTPTCSNAGGWEKVKYGGYTRYRQLWTTIA